jgi:hypothetical protein
VSFCTQPERTSTCPPEECGGPQGYLQRRNEAYDDDALQDMGVMVEWLEEILQMDVGSRTVGELTPDVTRMAMERMVARGPFLQEKFARKPVNQEFLRGRHRDLMRQQFV